MSEGCKECPSKYVVNKKYELCDNCNFRRLHNGMSKQEVEREKQANKSPISTKPEIILVCKECKGKSGPVTNRTHCLCEVCMHLRTYGITLKERLEQKEKLRTITNKEKGIEPKRTKKYKYTRKITGELDTFKEIWDERPHFSEISGKPIYEFNPHCFSHILTKGAYGVFRNYKKNIKLVLPEEHDLWEFGDRDELRKDIRWNWVFEKHQELISEYYNK